jgi:EAL domain-containing protein (putative c-di-GMP-specific phosphodiesterase class I)
MFSMDNVHEWGRRASDRQPTEAIQRRAERALEAVIAKEQVDVLFQPWIEPQSGRVGGAEALARAAIVPDPEELFARAAAAGLSERLSRVVQRKALRCAAGWEGPLEELGVSINILPADISREGYDLWLLHEIEDAGIDPGRVTAEITESALLVDQEAVVERLTALRGAGVKVAVDDFGTGYASLAYLTSLPLDAIKIDRGLVTDLVGGERDRIVVKALLHLARELGLKVVVEGVETTGQLELLAEWGCDLYQGFLGAGALTQAELARFVAMANAERA